jgi:indole-3-glycerol phosphate synthase
MSILDRIVATKREEVADRRRRTPIEGVIEAARAAERPRHFHSAIAALPAGDIHLIAEIKRKSPSGGVLRDPFDPVEIASVYANAGASAISVLTDETYFDGRLEYIGRVRAAVPLPVLRKDFIIDEYQVYESRAAGADAVLLIAEILTPSEMLDMLIVANELKMTALIEVHEADALMRFRSVVGFPLRHYNLLGINNRNLRTEAVSLSTTPRLISLIEEDEIIVTESGIRTRKDVQYVARAGARAMLVGETLMRAADPAATIRELLGLD